MLQIPYMKINFYLLNLALFHHNGLLLVRLLEQQIFTSNKILKSS